MFALRAVNGRFPFSKSDRANDNLPGSWPGRGGGANDHLPGAACGAPGKWQTIANRLNAALCGAGHF
jgi:hypothetical protein